VSGGRCPVRKEEKGRAVAGLRVEISKREAKAW